MTPSEESDTEIVTALMELINDFDCKSADDVRQVMSRAAEICQLIIAGVEDIDGAPGGDL